MQPRNPGPPPYAIGRRWLAAALIALCALNASPAAQVTAKPQAEAPKSGPTSATYRLPPATRKFPASPPAERAIRANPDMIEAMARLLGQGHYFQTLCGDPADLKWRNFMERVINQETQGPLGVTSREVLTGQFNNAFLALQTDWPQCTPEARQKLGQIEHDTQGLARAITRQYSTIGK